MFTNKDYATLSNIDLFKNKEQSTKMIKLIDKDAKLKDLVNLKDNLSIRIFSTYIYLGDNNTIEERESINKSLKKENKLCMKKVI